MSYTVADIATMMGLSKTAVRRIVSANPARFKARKVPNPRGGVAPSTFEIDATEAEVRELLKWNTPRPRGPRSAKAVKNAAKKDLWTIEEAAAHAGVNKSTAYGRAKAWNITSVRYNGKALYPRKFVERLVAERPQPKAPERVHLRTTIGDATVHARLTAIEASLERLDQKMDAMNSILQRLL